MQIISKQDPVTARHSGRPSIVSASNNQTMFDQLICQQVSALLSPIGIWPKQSLLAKTISFGRYKVYRQTYRKWQWTGSQPLAVYWQKRKIVLAKIKHFGQKRLYQSNNNFGQNLVFEISNIWCRYFGLKTVSVVR